jgi:hypothetical protein
MAADFDRVLSNNSQGGRPDDMILAGMQRNTINLAPTAPAVPVYLAGRSKSKSQLISGRVSRRMSS